MTIKSKKLKIINLDSILLTISNYIYKIDNNFKDIYNLDKPIPLHKHLFLDKLIQHYFLREVFNIIKHQNLNQKTVILVQPYSDRSMYILEGSTGKLVYKQLKKLIKNIQSLIPIYFCFLDNNISLNNVNYIEDLNNQKDLYYLLIELTNINKKYNIKKLKTFLIKNGFNTILEEYFQNNNNLLNINKY